MFASRPRASASCARPRSPLRLLIGMPEATTRSGPNACEPPFVAALRTLEVDVVEETYVYGDNLEAKGPIERVGRVGRAAWRLRKRMRTEHFDVLHLNTSFDTKTVLRDAFTLAVLGRPSVPVFLKLHGSDPSTLTSGPRPVRMIARHVLRRAAAIGVLSSEEKTNFAAAGIPAEKLHIVRNAVSTPAVLPSREEFLASRELPAGTPLLLFISRLVPTKGLLDVVRACGILRDSGRSSVLCCVGDGPARAEAEHEAARLRLDGGVRFFGYVPESEASAFYQHCDALVFPTFHDEGLPIVLLNALVAGLPIVTTRTRAAVDYLTEPDTCLWVHPHDPAEVAARVEELLEDDGLRATMSVRAREQARDFDPANVARAYLELYQLLASPGRLPASAPAVDLHGVARP